MLFTQPEFLIFAVVVLLITWRLSNFPKKLFLLVASYYFYAYWDFRFLALIFVSTCIDYTLAFLIAKASSERLRTSYLTLSVVANLGLLGFFKYFNFFVESAKPIAESLGLEATTLEIILPIGISFYTFQTLSYTIDVYRGKLEARTSFLDVALFVAFFPQLVAGPVVRAAELLPQFEEAPPWSLVDFYFGFQQFLRGAVKKIVVADHLAFAVDEIFANEGVYGTTTIWIGVLAYAGQIYCDFSGYSDMAIGLAKMLGYRFCPNFNHPYVATSIQEFWKRWHISLSQWLRDYLYIPLGGNRLGSVRTNLNLMITMTLGGLWHGAAWTFVVWGVLHGIALVTHRNLLHGLLSSRSLGKLVGWALTFVLVLTAWVFFRAESFTQSLSMLGKMYVPTDGHLWLPTVPLLLLLALTVEHVIYVFHNRIFELPPTRWYSPIITALMIWAILMFPAGEFRPFVYFQF